MNKNTSRPSPSQYSSPKDYLLAMIQYRKETEAAFSVVRAAKNLRRVSPALISLIRKGDRRITLDRANELAQLANFNSTERAYFINWIKGQEQGEPEEIKSSRESRIGRRKVVSTHLLSDWINVYVKDLFQLQEIQKNPQLVYQRLAAVASPQRIDKSIKFLLKEGHLKRTSEDRIVIDENLSVANPGVPSKKIRNFHKGALKIAHSGIDLYSAEERLANALTIPLSEESYLELMEIVSEFAESLQKFAERDSQAGDRLYQILLNICPVGGKSL